MKTIVACVFSIVIVIISLLSAGCGTNLQGNPPARTEIPVPEISLPATMETASFALG